MSQLQELMGEFGCNVLNYKNTKIVVDHFYSEERYIDFLKGINCRAGMGLFDADEELEFNKLKDNILVIIQKDGIETARYKYVPILKATMQYKDKNTDNKKINKTLTFTIRRNDFNKTINFIDTEGKSLNFYNVQAVKNYLNEKYGVNKLIDWNVY